MNKRARRLSFVIMLLFLTLFSVGISAQQRERVRILRIMSYHAAWPWNIDQVSGFRDGLSIPDADMRIVELDAKRQSSQAGIEAAGHSVLQIIADWAPDLIYLNDDALDYILENYHRLDIPMVFSGINATAEEIPESIRSWATGVLEEEHALGSIRLLQAIQSKVRKLVIVTDESPIWNPVVGRLQDIDTRLPEIEIVRWDVIRSFEEYKQKILEYQDTVDAIGLLEIYLFKDQDGSNVS